MQIRLSDHFTYSRLLRFTLPSVVTMIVASIYSVVDRLFVSNLVGAMALSAINIAFPVAMIIGAVGFMLGTGGSALVAKTLGEGKKGAGKSVFFHVDLQYYRNRCNTDGNYSYFCPSYYAPCRSQRPSYGKQCDLWDYPD